MPIWNITRDSNGSCIQVHDLNARGICSIYMNPVPYETVSYSNKENGIISSANKEVIRHIRNILADKECVDNWPKMLCMTKRMLSSLSL